MRISRLYVTNFLGIQQVDLLLRAPILLVCGDNASGKSSLFDAVALTLTAELRRVALKKDAPALLHNDADLAVCEVEDSDGDAWRVTINSAGKIVDSQKGREPDPVLPFVLDAQRFAQLPTADRRGFLFNMMGVTMAPADISARLHALGCDGAKVARIVPLLRGGFEPAESEARRKTTEARGAWKAITGEAYGSEKAKTWRATVPHYDAAAVAALTTELKHLDVAIDQWQKKIDAEQLAETRLQALSNGLQGLQRDADKIVRLEIKLAADIEHMQAAELEVKNAQAAAGNAPRVGLVHELARLVSIATFATPEDATCSQVAIQAYEHEYGPVDLPIGGDQHARARLPELHAAWQMTCRTVSNDRRDVDQAKAAAAEVQRRTLEMKETRFDPDGLAEARSQVESLRGKRAATAVELEKVKAVKRLIEAAEAKTQEAAQHHADVAAWDHIATQLSADGIPAKLLAEALGPINERLEQSALDADWPRVTIRGDMTVLYGPLNLPYALLSESERWRTDAMVAEAISFLSGTRLLVLDRMDALDIAGRSELLGWLQTLVEHGELSTALLFATLKAPPTGLGDSVQVEWLDDGVIVPQKLKEAA